MVVMLWRQMGISWRTQFEFKLEVHSSIIDTDVHFCLARLAGPNLHDFLHTIQKESFLCKVKGDPVCGVHSDFLWFWPSKEKLHGSHGSGVLLDTIV